MEFKRIMNKILKGKKENVQMNKIKEAQDKECQKEHTKEFCEMSKPEKKRFLSMDLAERMMRVEQSVSASFNKYIPYTQTEYYKSMNEKEKEQFQQYLKNKGKKKALLISFAILPLIVVSLFRISFTGNAIRENIGTGTSFVFEIICVILFVSILIVLLYSNFIQKRMEDKLNKHLKVIDNIIVKKSMTKK
jgi:hypothetical protein